MLCWVEGLENLIKPQTGAAIDAADANTTTTLAH